MTYQASEMFNLKAILVSLLLLHNFSFVYYTIDASASF